MERDEAELSEEFQERAPDHEIDDVEELAPRADEIDQAASPSGNDLGVEDPEATRLTGRG